MSAAELHAINDRAAVARAAGLTPAELQRAEDTAFAAAGAAIAAGASEFDALRAASDAGIEYVRSILRTRASN